jgi:hypothetical protein
MNKAVNQIRLFLCTCSGEDDFIIRKCSKTIQLRFALIGFFVLFIFFCCFLSATFFTYSLFQGTSWVSIPMGIIWGAIVANIYLLLLYTISPKLLPVAFKNKIGQTIDNRNNAQKVSFISSSILFRLGLMALLAIIIAQPLNVILLSKSVETSIEKHKIIEKIKMFTIANKSSIENEILYFKDFNEKIKYQLNDTDSISLSKQIVLLNSKVTDDKLFLINSNKLLNAFKKIDESNFLNKRSKIKRNKIIASLNTLLDDEVQSDNQFISTIESVFITNSKVKKHFDTYKTNLIEVINLKNENSDTLDILLRKSNFYIKTIQLLLNENPYSWLITLLVCLAFLLPIYFKFKVRDLSKSFFKADYENNPEMRRLRNEIVNTTDFDWLERKIKNVGFEDLRTSDYYFKRMVIEHRIILDEYEKAKNKHSKILTQKVALYNENSLSRLVPLLEKLKKIDLKIYIEVKKEIDDEYKNEVIKKYEYWIDAPFRTKKRNALSIKNDEAGLLQLIYPGNENQQ